MRLNETFHLSSILSSLHQLLLLRNRVITRGHDLLRLSHPLLCCGPFVYEILSGLRHTSYIIGLYYLFTILVYSVVTG